MICMYIYMRNIICTCIPHIYTPTYTYTHTVGQKTNWHMYLYTDMHASMHATVHTAFVYIFIDICMYTHGYTSISGNLYKYNMV